MCTYVIESFERVIMEGGREEGGREGERGWG